MVEAAKRVAYLNGAFRAAQDRGDRTVIDGIGFDAQEAHNRMQDLLGRRRVALDRPVSEASARVTPTGERPVGERATAVQVGAVRDFISTMREALDKLEEAFEEGD